MPPGPVPLSLADALKRGLTSNLGPLTASSAVRTARAERLQALSALRPNITATASNTVTQTNLAAYGFQFKLPPNSGFSIPSVVGPYNYSSLQGALSQPLFDRVSLHNWQSAKASEGCV